MSDEELFRSAAEHAKKHPPNGHEHGLACTFEVCGVGPTRASLIEASLRKNRRPDPVTPLVPDDGRLN